MSEAIQPSEALVEQSRAVTPAEIDALMGHESSPETDAAWQDQIDRALLVVTGRDQQSGELLGIGFVVGSMRHAELVDWNVREGERQQGIGAKIGEQMLSFVHDNNIRYVGLTFDPKTPWLRGLYERAGFRQIDFAMWHEDSLRGME